MMMLGWIVLMVCWFAWAYPFIFRAPHNQKRPSITAVGPTRAGLLLESLAIFIAFACRLPAGTFARGLAHRRRPLSAGSSPPCSRGARCGTWAGSSASTPAFTKTTNW